MHHGAPLSSKTKFVPTGCPQRVHTTPVAQSASTTTENGGDSWSMAPGQQQVTCAPWPRIPCSSSPGSRRRGACANIRPPAVNERIPRTSVTPTGASGMRQRVAKAERPVGATVGSASWGPLSLPSTCSAAARFSRCWSVVVGQLVVEALGLVELIFEGHDAAG
jgi:hypothetical protein